MNRIVLVLFSFFTVGMLSAQVDPVKMKLDFKDEKNFNLNDTLNRGPNRKAGGGGVKNLNAKIEMYKIISRAHDTTIVDTTLTIYKDYKFNYLRRDDFDLLPFSNIGQTYNTLSHDFSTNQLLPSFGARARHFNFIELEDVNYYYMPTPFTELMYKTAFEQGQLLDAFFTVNTSKQFNFSIAYKGMRSLGKYQHILTSSGNFRFTINYKSKNGKYNVRAHTVMQDLLNQENGGILDEDLEKFKSGNEEFIDRSVFDPAFENAESVLKGKRFHIDQTYNLVQQKDSTRNNTLSIGNIVTSEEKYYQYEQSAAYTDLFGEAFVSSNLNDKVTLTDVYAEANAKYRNQTLGELKFKIGYNSFNYGYNKLVSLNEQNITNRLKGHVVSVGGGYKNVIGKVLLEGAFGINISGDFDGNFLDATAKYSLNDSTSVLATLNINSKPANYNTLLYQSDYLNYNWQNNFDNIETKQLGFQFKSKKLVDVAIDYTSIHNYTYFEKTEADNNLLKPHQFGDALNYFRIKLTKEFRYGKFALNNTIRYQKVLDGEGLLNVPEIVSRNTLYYSSHFFEKALFLQTGLTFSYFSSYHMNAYDPLLAEFYVQNQNEIGDFPRIDFFINAKIQQTRIYLKAEHLNSALTGYNYYSAPNYPYRDFAVRFGIVWNFFL